MKIEFLLYLPVIYLVDKGLFYLIERQCCKKCNGDCSKCKAWSCYKGNLEYKKGSKFSKKEEVSK